AGACRDPPACPCDSCASGDHAVSDTGRLGVLLHVHGTGCQIAPPRSLPSRFVHAFRVRARDRVGTSDGRRTAAPLHRASAVLPQGNASCSSREREGSTPSARTRSETCRETLARPPRAPSSTSSGGELASLAPR